MPAASHKKLALLISGVALILLCSAAFLLYTLAANKPAAAPSEKIAVPSEAVAVQEPTSQPVEEYKGQDTLVADVFTIKIPNGWKASISHSPSFLGVMFARPNQLDSLIYNPDVSPAIDELGIPSWSGLTEHFFIIAPLSSQHFNPSDHLEVSSEPFSFDDGVIGQKYYVVKHASEAQKFGGLQKDTEWQGRTYIYEKDESHVEAHLALYPSSGVDVEFYEKVVRSLRL